MITHCINSSSYVLVQGEMDNTHIHLPGHQAHPIQPVPQTGDEEEDLGRREEARSLLTCTVLERFMIGQTIKQLDLIFLQSSSFMKPTLSIIPRSKCC